MVQEIIDVVVNAFTGLITGLSGGVVDAFETMFTTSEGKLTTFAIVGLIGLGISAAFGVLKLVTRKIG